MTCRARSTAGRVHAHSRVDRRCPLSSTLCAALLASSALIVPQPSAADDASGRWLLVPMLAGEAARDLHSGELTRALENSLRAADAAIMPNAAAGALLETRHSSPPQQLTEGELSRLSRSSNQAARHLALGELADAQRAQQELLALAAPARDAFQREPARARKLFNNCLMAAYLYERAAQHTDALRQMLDCARGFPALRPEGRAYPAELHQLFDQAGSQLGSVALSVHSADQTGCAVRLNGIPVGKTPLRLPALRGGSVRLQVECDAIPARVYSVELHDGENSFTVDPSFDSALHTHGALGLRYANEHERERRGYEHAEQVADALGVTRVALLWIALGPVGPELSLRALDARAARERALDAGAARELARVPLTSGGGYSRESEQVCVRALLERDGPQPMATPAALRPQPEQAAPSSRPPTEVVADDRPSPARKSQQHAVAGAILAVLGGAGIAVSWVAYALRQPERRALEAEADTDEYRVLGVVTLTAGALGTTLFSVSELFWLPDDPGVPAMAWAVGAFGLGLGAAALALALTNSDCTIGDPRVSCQRFTSDHYFAPLLAMHALPLITAPLWYALRVAVRPAPAEIGLTSDARGQLQITLRGQF